MNVAVNQASLGAAHGAFDAARFPGDRRVAETRERAFAEFARTGLPTRRVEEWKYTDLRALLRDIAPLAPAPGEAALTAAAEAIAKLGLTDAAKLVLVDGAFAPSLSETSFEAGVSVRALRDILTDASIEHAADLLLARESDPMLALNAAMTGDGFVIDVAAGAAPSRPIHLVHVATQGRVAAVTRTLAKINADARATLVEHFIATESAAAYQVHDAMVIGIGDDADLQHVRVVADAADAANIASAIVTMGARCSYNTFSMTTGSSLSRYQSFITLAGEDSQLTTNSIHLLRKQQHGDCTFVIDHAVPGCTSRETFRAVLDDRARSVFQGKTIVKPHAQKTDGKMMSRALLLSDDAEIDNKPELEIFADDVQCGHGAAVGALDDSLLFYLRARGLDEKAAEALLIQAFVGEAIEAIANDELRDSVIASAESWLETRT
jgi:Fe-S cluster assembly protein SufD